MDQLKCNRDTTIIQFVLLKHLPLFFFLSSQPLLLLQPSPEADMPTAMATIQSSVILRPPSIGVRRHLRIRPSCVSMKDGMKMVAGELKLEPEPKMVEDNLRFDRLQRLEEELDCRHRREFGRFVAREAQIDEEYWTAGWLRAESHWEDKPNVRYADNFKRQFAEREFVSLKRRCNSQLAEKSTCIIAVKRKERNVKQTVLSCVVGTLDLSMRHRVTEMFPVDPLKSPMFSSIYRTDQPRFGYVSNLCVARYARRQGIASNMLQLAIEAAKSYGACQVFVHVHKENTGARKLYDNLGFQMVGVAPFESFEEQTYLLSHTT